MSVCTVYRVEWGECELYLKQKKHNNSKSWKSMFFFLSPEACHYIYAADNLSTKAHIYWLLIKTVSVI